MKINKKKVISFSILGALTLGMIGCASWDRMTKSVSSDLGGGLNRKVTVYDMNGDEIKSWEGKFDVSENDSKVYFDREDGKRVIIYNAVVINEEQ